MVLKNIKDKILKIVTSGALILSAVFAFLLKKTKQKGQEEKISQLQKEKISVEKKAEVIEEVQRAENEVKKSYEEKVQKATSGHRLSNYNASMAILSDD